MAQGELSCNRQHVTSVGCTLPSVAGRANRCAVCAPAATGVKFLAMLYTLCYPTLSDKDHDFIRSFRREHDLPFRDIVEHHFTIVFGISDISTDKYVAHVRANLLGQSSINFVCRYAALGDDSDSDDFYAFLTPDEGFSDICRLHDKLYSGDFKKFHRFEIPYTPHIGIATMPDARKIQSLCDELNANSFKISGALESATICEYDGTKVVNLERVDFET